MFNAQPSSFLSSLPRSASLPLLKLALGVATLVLLSNYQPAISLPPLRKTLVYAEEQNPVIIPSKLPLQFQLPHKGYLSTPFSNYHPGIDIATGFGMPIHPIAEGEVLGTGFDLWGLGLTVTVKHDHSYTSTYAHLNRIFAKKGDKVTPSSTIGEVGLTGHTSGPHTHLEIQKAGKNINPLPILPTIKDYPTEEDFKAVTTAQKPPN